MNNNIHTIEIAMRPFPIYQSDYLSWTILLANALKKNKQEFLAFYRTVLTLANDEWIPENLEIKINGEVLTAHNVFTFDLVSATRDIKTGKYKRGSNELCIYHHSTIKPRILLPSKKQQEPKDFLVFVQNYVANFTVEGTIYYHTLPVTEDILFKLQSDETGEVYKKIRRELLPFLRFFDLSNISFQDVDIREEDLSYTNIKGLDISKTYKKSARGANLKGVVFDDKVIGSCDMSDCILGECYAYIDVTTTKTEGMIYDAHVVFLDSEGHIIKNSMPKRKDNCIILHF